MGKPNTRDETDSYKAPDDFGETKDEPSSDSSDAQTRFREELLRYLDVMYHFAFSLTHKQNDAEDLVQEALVKALKNYRQFEQGTNLRAWLLTIIRNSYINQYRKQQRGPTEVDFSEVEPLVSNDEAVGQVESDELSLDDLKQLETFEDQLEDRVKKALDELPDEFRQIFLLAVIKNLSYKEISELLNIPVGTVMSRLFRARKQMYKKLKNYAKELGIVDKSADSNKKNN